MRSLLLPVALFFSVNMAAQTKKKPETPPSQKEIQAMLNEAQKSMDGMSAEDKALLESMGIKLPDTKQLKKTAAFAEANAGKQERSRLVPQKDAARIASIPPPIKDENMAVYLKNLQAKMAATLEAKTVDKGNTVFSYIKSVAKNNHTAGNMAMALWIKGQPKMALYVMGRICADDGTDIDNQCNYSSMLVMLGGEHVAIPLLNNLNAIFPQNSTILNNLGQAWFGLGDVPKAEKYLDSAIALFSFHPQANLTKALIEESKGNTSKAVECVKNSIHNLYSPGKEEQLEKLGSELDAKDFVWGRPNATDQLGLSKIEWPPFPKSTNESETAELAWAQFVHDIETAKSELEAQEAPLLEAMQEAQKNMLKGSGDLAASFGPLTIKAQKKLWPYIENLIELEGADPMGEAFISLRNTIDSLKEITSKAEQVLVETKSIKMGEGSVVPESVCSEINGLRDNFLNTANTKVEAVLNRYRNLKYKRITEMVNYQLYTDYPEKFEFGIYTAKLEWLGYMAGVYEQVQFMTKTGLCQGKLKEEAKPSKKLMKFDDVACTYNDTLNLGIMTFTNNCSRMRSKLDLKFVEYTRYDDFERAEGDEYMSSTLKISAERGFDNLKFDKGPLKMEAKIGGSIELEMDRQGISDIIISAEAKAGAGHNMFDEGLEKQGSIAGKDMIDTTLEVGVEGRISLISGQRSLEGTGILKSLKL